MSLKSFSDYISAENAPRILDETFAGMAGKTAAMTILTKMSGLRQAIQRDKTAHKTEQELANMLYLLASLMTVAIAEITNDPDLANRIQHP